MPNPHLVVVPHTHWDREWYRTHEAFRVRLVALVDARPRRCSRAIPTSATSRSTARPSSWTTTSRCGPHARARIEKLVREGRLLVGPWHVLPDEWLVSGEALIRNLRFGLAARRGARRRHALGYVPDQFGHVGQLPQIFAALRLRRRGAVARRRRGRDRDGLLVGGAGRHAAPHALSGERATAMRRFFPSKPKPSPRVSIARLRQLAPLRSRSDVLLDERKRSSPARAGASRSPRRSRPPHEEPRELRDRHAASRPCARCARSRVIARRSIAASCAPVCARRSSPAARRRDTAQKQREFANDHLLTRVLEPLAAWAALLGGARGSRADRLHLGRRAREPSARFDLRLLRRRRARADGDALRSRARAGGRAARRPAGSPGRAPRTRAGEGARRRCVRRLESRTPGASRRWKPSSSSISRVSIRRA